MAHRDKDPWSSFKTVGSERDERGEEPKGGIGTLVMLIGLAAVVGWIGGVFLGSYFFFRAAHVVVKVEDAFDWAFWICGAGGSIFSVVFVIGTWISSGSKE